MKQNRKIAETLFQKTLSAVLGLFQDSQKPLGSISINDSTRIDDTKSDLTSLPLQLLLWAVSESKVVGMESKEINHNQAAIVDLLEQEVKRAKEVFCTYYEAEKRIDRAQEALALLVDPEVSLEKKAETVSGIWAPEKEMSEEDIIRRWRLTEVEPNPQPIKPTEVVLQLNALYTLPETDRYGRPVAHIPPSQKEEAKRLLADPGRKLADYDHPVHLFEEDERHELIACLKELEEELAFEKKQGVLPTEYALPVLLSISVTYSNLDVPSGTWIIEKISSLGLSNIKVIVLTEQAIERIKKDLLEVDIHAYSVFGKYGVHFNALKFTQLLLERPYGIRAGFKLDTDEGIRSRDLFAATGKTWFETLCHSLWGGKGRDWQGRKTELVFNLGEYIDSKDIDRLGYKKSMREPDVKASGYLKNPNLFFNKGAAHAKATALYNQFDFLEDHISHTVVKGGGYGITNYGLSSYLPFTFSKVGRAEDQQFYFSRLSAGARGIFHPDLRIAHYKGSVFSSEDKTEVSRFLGDTYRLVLFRHLAEIAEVKEDIDPMPGVFAGELARAQAFFHLLYKSLAYYHSGQHEKGDQCMFGWKEISLLIKEIDNGTVKKQVEKERREWEKFTETACKVEPDKARDLFDDLSV